MFNSTSQLALKDIHVCTAGGPVFSREDGSRLECSGTEPPSELVNLRHHTNQEDVSADSGVRRLPPFTYPAAAEAKYEVFYLTVSLVFEFSRAKSNTQLAHDSISMSRDQKK